VYAQSGNGAFFTDVDGNTFLDFVCSFGPISLGHNYPRVNNAVIDQLNKGILFSLPHPIELELAEKISKIVPHTDMCKFEKSGSNAVTGAVRAARAFSKREKIAYCGSGGVWHDWQAAMVSRDGGVPHFNQELIKIFEYNDTDGLEQIFEDNPEEIAAIVLEPTIFEKPQKDFLTKVRKIADDENAVLILDEVVTGFRFSIGGAQEYFDIKGDLVCFGKSMANGLPLSAITGKSEFMKIFDDVWVSSTNNMETLSLAGSLATINEMSEKNTISKCWDVGTLLKNGWNKITTKYGINAKLDGYGVRMNLKCYDSQNNESLPLKSLLLQELLKKGVFLAPLGPIYISYSHEKNDVANTLVKLEEICSILSEKISNDNFTEFIEGKIPQKIWDLKILPTKKKV
jgi:glutamate-1-semialdehyde 2,1-aminomutase